MNFNPSLFNKCASNTDAQRQSQQAAFTEELTKRAANALIGTIIGGAVNGKEGLKRGFGTGLGADAGGIVAMLAARALGAEIAPSMAAGLAGSALGGIGGYKIADHLIADGKKKRELDEASAKLPAIAFLKEQGLNSDEIAAILARKAW